jgi:hypothetical protein
MTQWCCKYHTCLTYTISYFYIQMQRLLKQIHSCCHYIDDCIIFYYWWLTYFMIIIHHRTRLYCQCNAWYIWQSLMIIFKVIQSFAKNVRWHLIISATRFKSFVKYNIPVISHNYNHYLKLDIQNSLILHSIWNRGCILVYPNIGIQPLFHILCNINEFCISNFR